MELIFGRPSGHYNLSSANQPSRVNHGRLVDGEGEEDTTGPMLQANLIIWMHRLLDTILGRQVALEATSLRARRDMVSFLFPSPISIFRSLLFSAVRGYPRRAWIT